MAVGLRAGGLDRGDRIAGAQEAAELRRPLRERAGNRCAQRDDVAGSRTHARDRFALRHGVADAPGKLDQRSLAAGNDRRDAASGDDHAAPLEADRNAAEDRPQHHEQEHAADHATARRSSDSK